VVFLNSHARYTLPDHLPLVLALGTALGAAQVSFLSLLARSVTLGLGLLYWAQASARIAHGPATAPVPAVDIAQYVTGPWSGRGLGEVRRHLAAVSEKEDERVRTLESPEHGIVDPAIHVNQVVIGEHFMVGESSC
jgi:hypothetical protein